MTRYVFLDVGAHRGQTTEEVLGPLWAFDRVCAFEPDPECVSLLHSRFAAETAAGRLEITPAALSSRTGEAKLYGSNSGGGASLFAEKRNVNSELAASIRLVRASDWLRENTTPADFVLMKLNCEGAEVDILRDLVETGEISRIGALMVDFDIRKVRGRRGEARQTIRRMHAAGFHRFHLSEFVMVGDSHGAKIRNWLSFVPESTRFCREPSALAGYRRRPILRRRIRYWLRY